jgi:hypothetical protein
VERLAGPDGRAGTGADEPAVAGAAAARRRQRGLRSRAGPYDGGRGVAPLRERHAARAGGVRQPPPALEAYVESFQAGFVNGKLVLAFAAEPGWLIEALARSPRRELAGDGTARRHALAEADLTQAQGLPLAALAFRPAARLDEATVVARFGPPAERLPVHRANCSCSIRRSTAVALPPG